MFARHIAYTGDSRDLGLTCLVMSIVCFVVFIVKSKGNRKMLMFIGIRNICLLPAVYLISQATSASWTSYSDIEGVADDWVRSISWNIDYLLYASVYALIVLVVFSFISKLLSRHYKNKQR